MKKLTRKLFVSLMTLVLTAMALGTSTFAWFSMNTTATATGMQVQAKSNARYLLIGNNANIGTTKKNTDNNAITETVAALLTDTGTGEALYRFPAYYGPKSVVKSGEASTVGWWSASNKNTNNATDNVVGVSEISSTDLNQYVLTYKVWLTLSTDSVDYNGKITCSLVKISDSDAAIAAVVEIGSDTLSLNPTDTQFENATAGQVITGVQAQTTSNVAITKSTAVEVTIKIYIDGTSSHVYSDYINGGQNIIGKCSIQFDLE